MKIALLPSHRNDHPRSGLLIKGDSVRYWLQEIHFLGLTLEEIKVYPMPDTMINSLWGCLVITKSVGELPDTRHPICQLIEGKLFIPPNSTIHPYLTSAELTKLAGQNRSVFHPAFGLVSLDEEVDWTEFLTLSKPGDFLFKQPVKSKKIPSGEIKSFKIQAPPPEELLKEMEQEAFPQRESLKEKPLNVAEKVKLAILRFLLTKKTKEAAGNAAESNAQEESPKSFWSRLFSRSKFVKKLSLDLEELERRNQKEIDKLLSLFKDDPEKALKYAIPLDEGAGRGNQGASPFQLNPRWGNFNLFGNRGTGNGDGGGGSISIGDDQFLSLRQQYENTAKALEDKEEYKKAAFIHMKLLKNHYIAAQTLEKGKFYGEAASIYLQYNNNKEQAAVCYEKGMMFEQAIELRKDLKDHEKVGDLYTLLNEESEANHFYSKVVDKHTEQNHYLKASDVLRNKMNQPKKSQEVLLGGWKEGVDPFNCLNRYLSDFEDEKGLEKEVRSLYEKEVNDKNIDAFLQVILKEYGRNRDSANSSREIAYEILVKQAKSNPALLSELKQLNSGDPTIFKDILRYRHKK